MYAGTARQAETGRLGWHYERRRPERTLLYQLVAEHYPRFLELLANQGRSLPDYVQRELEDFLKCGRLEHEFLRVQCTGAMPSGWCAQTPVVRQAPPLKVLSVTIILDPGIGFGKRTVHNLALLANLGRFVYTGHPVLLGASCKRFMGDVCGEMEVGGEQLMPATCATSALGIMAGVAIYRVHDVWQNRQAVDVAWAIRQHSAM